MMISPTRITTVVVMTLLFSGMVRGEPNTSLVKQLCTLRHYQDYGGYDNCVHYVIEEIIVMTAEHGYSYSVDGRSQDEFSGKCYGHAVCNGKLSPRDCTSCLDDALSGMRDYCTTSGGARIKLQDCRIRYEDYLFDPDY